jgi:hypothetical protein
MSSGGLAAVEAAGAPSAWDVSVVTRSGAGRREATLSWGIASLLVSFLLLLMLLLPEFEWMVLCGKPTGQKNTREVPRYSTCKKKKKRIGGH